MQTLKIPKESFVTLKKPNKSLICLLYTSDAADD